MASLSSSKNRSTTTLAYTILIIITLVVAQSKHAKACFKSIISFGDSIADTGSLLYLASPSPSATPLNFGLPPYGETFFHRPTGRFSDGRLIIDFIAEELQLPLVPPFQNGKKVSAGDYDGGVNFAVGGATALADEFFKKHGVRIPWANASLVAQLSWFKDKFLPAFCQNPTNCSTFLRKSLVLMGEIGGNDYNHAFLGGKSVSVVRSFVPEVIKTVALTIQELIKLGAVTSGSRELSHWMLTSLSYVLQKFQ